MPDKAHVSSLDALEAFRSFLIVYLSQARPALEEVGAEVTRTRMWLENDQRLFWENQMRRRMKELEQAQQALFSARLGALKKESAVELMAVQRAKRNVEEGDFKLRTLKRWNREFDSRVQPLLKQTEKLHTVFTNDMVKAVAFLTQAINTLAAYSERQAPPSAGSAPAVAPAEPGTAPSTPSPQSTGGES